MKTKWKIAVLKGGPSSEREVSLMSGAAVGRALREAGHDVAEMDVRDGSFVLAPGTDIAFLALHGPFGEDGEVQAILEARGVPYTGCGVAASRRAIDKAETKRLFAAAGVPSAEFEIVRRGGRPTMRPPVAVKPSRQGSSVGVVLVRGDAEMERALAEAGRWDEEIVVERLIAGRELTVGMLDGETLPIVEVVPKEGFYNYENKYTAGKSEHLCPAPLPPAAAGRVADAARAAWKALGCEVYARIDVLLDGAGAPFVLEANTIPGMTEMSLLPDAARAAGMGFAALCERIIELSLRARRGGPD